MKISSINLASGLFVVVFLFGIALSVTNLPINNINDENLNSNTNSLPLSQSITFNQAVDNPNLTFTFGGNANWFVVTNTSYYGGSSVESGNINDSQSSYFETTIQGSGTIIFYWAVSSEYNYDYLSFDVDGSQFGSICGNVRFNQQSFNITTTGSHTLEWIYSKDGSDSFGGDCGWVDYIQWIPQNPYNITLNAITPNPSTIGNASLNWNSVPNATSYYVYRSTNPINTIQGLTSIASVTNTSYEDSNLSNGTYYYAVTAVNSTGESPISNCRPVLISSFNNALDNAKLSFNTGGTAQWYPETDTYYYGGSAMISGDITSYSSSSTSCWLGTTVTGNGTFLFYWFTSGFNVENYLSFSIDGVQQNTLTGQDTGWQMQKFNVTGTGVHELNWTYSEGPSGDNYNYNPNVQGGLDCGWVDDVQWIPQSPYSIILDQVQPNPSISGNVTLNWNSVPNATSYNVYRSTSPITSKQGLTPIGNVINPTYNDTNLAEGTYYYAITAINATTESNVSNCQTVVIVNFNKAVDNTGLSFNSGGDAQWSPENTTYYLNGSALQSGSITSSQSSWFSTTVQGNGTISFYWSVSSEIDYNYLSFYIDGVLQNNISGSVNWEKQQYIILGSGSHTLEWEYSKSSSTISGSDCGWVDDIQWTPPGPFFLYLDQIQPNPSLTGNVTLNWNSVTNATSYNVYRSTSPITSKQGLTPIGNTVNTTYNDTNLPDGTYYYAVTAINSTTESNVSNCQSIVTMNFNKAVDNTGFSFSSGGNALWFPENTTYYLNGSALQSGSIASSQSSWFSTTVQGNGIISFYWSVSSELDSNNLIFYIDGVEQNETSGTGGGWIEQQYNATGTGSHTLEWEYSKSSSTISGSDCGWVDDIQWTLQSPYSIFLSQIRPNPSTTGNITLNWNSVTNATSYNIYRSTSEITSKQGLTSIANVTSTTYTDNNLPLGTYYYAVTAINSTTESNVSNCRSVVVLTFNQAVDNTGLSFSSGGSAQWSPETTSYYLNDSAVQSGSITQYQSSWFETTVYGNGTIQFYWSVSSMSGYDYLEFYIDGSLQNEISGTGAGWTEQQYNVTGAGSHTLEWEYYKEYSSSAGSDCGWVDDIQWAPQNPYYLYLNQIQPNPSTTGNVTLNWNSVPNAISYNVYRSTSEITSNQGLTPIANVTNPTYSNNNLPVGTYYYAVTAINSTTESNVSNCQSVVVLTFNTAVDNMGLSFSYGGNAQWFPEITTYYTGGSAVQSGAITEYESSWFETTVNGNGTIQFYWSVSSESGYDYLEFYIDGVQQNKISGTSGGWTEQQYNVTGSGSHTLEWEYYKNYYSSAGSDCGWVDDIQWTPQTPYSIILNQIQPSPSLTGSVTLNWNSVTNATSYNVYRSTSEITSNQGLTPIGTVVNTTYTDNNLTDGTYYYAVTAINATTESNTSNCQSVVVTNFNPAVDSTGLSFSSGGNTQWFIENTTYYMGGSAVQSGTITQYQSSWFETTVNGNGTIRFYWSVSSEEYWDYLEFYIDGVYQYEISGTGGGWTLQQYNITGTGTHTLEWEYYKEYSSSAGSDCGWVDDIQWTPQSPYSIYLSQIQPNPSITGDVTLSWNSVTNATSYNIYRSTSEITSNQGLTPIGNVVNPTYTDNNLPLGTYYYAVTAINSTTESNVSDCQSVIVTSFNQAVDNSGLNFNFGGNAQWFPEITTYYTGGSAVESGDINDSQSSWFTTTVAGNGTLYFYWSVSSESGCDYLEFYIDGSLQNEISGMGGGWSEQQYSITGSGTHTLEWEYSKDGSVSDGSDCGWVDDVQWEPQNPYYLYLNPIQPNPSTTGNITLTWDSVINATSYNVYRSTSEITSNQGLTPIATVVNPIYTDNNLPLGTYYYAVTAINATTETNVSNCQSVLVMSFNDAVDNTGLSFSSGGNTQWFPETTTYYMGGSAVQSGVITQSQSSWFETTVNGNGTIRFYWSVSSMSGWDYLEFYIDGVYKNEISGTGAGWSEQQYNITGSGTHTLEWEYYKEYPYTVGSDCGWVDDIQWAPQNPFIIYLNQIQLNPSTGDVTLNWNSVPNATSYNVYRSMSEITSKQGLTPIGNVVNPTYTDNNLPIGTYYYAVTAINATTESNVSNCQSIFVSNFNQAIDSPGLSFSFGGDAQWFPEITTYYTGGSAVESGDITDSQSSWFTTTVVGNGMVTFYWSVSSESGCDYLEFYIDGSLQNEISGTGGGWSEQQYSITGSGPHTLEWDYSKDYSVSLGSDCGWVDDIQWAPQIQYNITLNAITPNPSTTGNITLNWNTITNANYYNIYRSTSSINSIQGLTPIGSIANTSYSDIGLHNGTYYYVVTAVNNTVESKISNCQSIVVSLSGTGTNLVTAPFPPLNLQVIGGIQQEILSWNAPSYNGGTPILGYNIYRGTTPGREAFLVTIVNASAITYIDRGLNNGTVYYYRVCANNSIGVGSLSNENSSITTAFPPTAPRDLRIYAGNGRAILSWTSPLCINSLSLTGYKIYRGTSSGNESYLTTVYTTSYTNTNLTNGQTYYYKIVAVNSIGDSPFSMENHVTPSADLSFILQVTLSHGHVILTWNIPPVYNGFDPITYKIYRGNSAGQETYITSVSNVLNFTDSGIKSGQTYYYEVLAYNSLGQGILSNQVHINSSNLSTGAIVAIATASAVGACLVVVGVIWYMKKKKLVRNIEEI